ncbi:MAG: CDP-diacylglycerol---glycerol-3-phosphate 3-phosphatidyltransferase [Petroclostridium sp.]|jgi:CDP-diacylglycerol--glycerol-3-phosphate 3-phosphatidyltransferase|uniref:CDP-diacylglycerol--glycerol-3-phosphate 3-phosphatidyltransferase n=1 Tax=Petroclostridium xylanilyticum TaxID=1792311 RepID=UPI000B98030A|nr:CDP-diacylglycerol--glycerol-3-phosphate 3-phosphatidyltransferase [Petroclostridium xylanilyticum]MBZ4646252.1 CDP-diacylglycerol/glycerol-3-phosphate 3-phosphatidyltransferase [Clostridia bacterium]MDK2810088.1 CDP-diacylglycerol---glycerol-3-phosphate 3-phosphatidyltransferase [Petroclostridium sp.]
MNLANKITMLRIFLVPIFMFFLLTKFPYGAYIAVGIFIIAAVTDGLDGYVARKWKLVTNFGKFVDPLADKLLVTAALISLVELNKLSSWVAMIIITREFVVTSLRVVAVSEGIIIAASMWGKIKTVTQIIAIVAILIDNFSFRLFGFSFGQITMLIAVIFTVFSGIDYLAKNWKVIDIN